MIKKLLNPLTSPRDPVYLGWFRIGVAFVLLLQAISLGGHLSDVAGSLGMAQSAVTCLYIPPVVPRIELMNGWADEGAVLSGVHALMLLSSIMLLLGWRTRLAAIMAWGSQLTLSSSAAMSSYGAQMFLNIWLFYAMVLPVGDALSLDVLARRRAAKPSTAAGLGVLLVRLHLCVVYLFSGVEKASGIQWWNGEAIWRTLMRTDFGGGSSYAWLASIPALPALVTISTIVVEAGYAVFVWLTPTRRAWALMIVGMHLGIVAMMGLTHFGLLMAYVNAAVWLPRPPREGRSLAVVAYDGACRVCRGAVSAALRLAPRSFRPVGVAHDDRVPALGAENLSREMVVLADGRTLRGAEAFLGLWGRSVGVPWLGVVGRLPLARATYRAFARRRARLGCGSRACELA